MFLGIIGSILVLCGIFYYSYYVKKISLSTSLSTVGFLIIILLAIFIALQPGGCLR